MGRFLKQNHGQSRWDRRRSGVLSSEFLININVK